MTPQDVMKAAQEISPEAAAMLLLLDKLEEAMGIKPKETPPCK
jgi:hypothetical protein